MRFRKTKSSQRTTYTYHSNDGSSQTIVPGENGVTEIHIKLLHSIDDSEVYYNLKNSRPSETDAEKSDKLSKIEEFKEQFKAAYGYEPTKDVIESFVEESFKKNWNLSLNQYESDTDGSNTMDLHMEFADPKATSFFDDSVPSGIDRLNEIISTLSPQRQAIYSLVLIDGNTNVYAASVLGISEGQVRKDIKKIKEAIAGDKILQEIFKNGTN